MDVELQCLRCEYRWKRRTTGKLPRQCPHCKSIRWNKPRVNQRVKESLEKFQEPRQSTPSVEKLTTEEMWLKGML